MSLPFSTVFPGIRKFTVTLPAHIQWDNSAAEKSPVVVSFTPSNLTSWFLPGIAANLANPENTHHRCN